MRNITATDAARHFSDLLDAVEHSGETFTVTRSGKGVAQIVPVEAVAGSIAKGVLLRHRPDRRWPDDIATVRSKLVLEDHSRNH